MCHCLSVAGLRFWEVVFSRRGLFGCFTLDGCSECDGSDDSVRHIRRLVFIVQNLLTKVFVCLFVLTIVVLMCMCTCMKDTVV